MLAFICDSVLVSFFFFDFAVLAVFDLSVYIPQSSDLFVNIATTEVADTCPLRTIFRKERLGTGAKSRMDCRTQFGAPDASQHTSNRFSACKRFCFRRIYLSVRYTRSHERASFSTTASKVAPRMAKALGISMIDTDQTRQGETAAISKCGTVARANWNRGSCMSTDQQ